MPFLYDIALHAFQPDYVKYGIYPPLLKQEHRQFLPPLMFGKTFFIGDEIIGGAFVLGIWKKGKIGAIFIDPIHQNRGLGRQAMLAIEKCYPKVKTWQLETPGESYELHRFYESLGYVKTGEVRHPGSGMTGFIYEKTL